MPYYAQKNYNTQLGNGKYTIAQAGCLLTATANLLQRYGVKMDPPTLDSYFKSHGDFIKDSDGALEDLAWNSITRVDSLVAVQQVGSSAVPPTADAIVKFHYQSIQAPYVLVDGKEIPNMVDHFCAVDRISGGQLFIIDSWDGLIKAPGSYAAYGKPIAWATYVKHAPVAAPAKPAAPKLPAAPVTAPPKVSYTVVRAIPGYVTATQAANHSKPTTTVPVGNYYVFNIDAGMKNVTAVYGRPGSWINPADNTLATLPPVQPKPAAPATYTVKRQLEGYSTSNDAANHLNDDAIVQPGTYYVFNQDHAMVNVTAVAGKPGSWINPTDNVAPTTKPAAPAPVPAVAASPASTLTETEQATAPNWRASYKPFPSQPSNYYATQTFIVHDLEQKRPDTTCNKYDLVPLAGTFIGPDGVLYGRTMLSTFPNLRTTPEAKAQPPYYYGLPMNLLMAETEVWSTNTDTASRQFTGTMTLRDHLVVWLGKLGGWLERFGKKQDVTKK